MAGTLLLMSAGAATALIAAGGASEAYRAELVLYWSVVQLVVAILAIGGARSWARMSGGTRWSTRRTVVYSAAGAGVVLVALVLLSASMLGDPVSLATASVATALLVWSTSTGEMARLAGHYVGGAIPQALPRYALGLSVVVGGAWIEPLAGPGVVLLGASLTAIGPTWVCRRWLVAGSDDGVWSDHDASMVGSTAASSFANLGPSVVAASFAPSGLALLVFLGSRLGQLVAAPGIALASKTASELTRRESGERGGPLHHGTSLQGEVSRATVLSVGVAIAAVAVGVYLSLDRSQAELVALAALIFSYTAVVATGPAAQLLLYRGSPLSVFRADAALGVGASACILAAAQLPSPTVATAVCLIGLGTLLVARNVVLAARVWWSMSVWTLVLPVPLGGRKQWT